MSDYKVHLSEEQLKALEEGQELDDTVKVLTRDGRVIETNDAEMLLILLGLDKTAS